MVNTLKYKKGDYVSFPYYYLTEKVGKIENIIKQGTWRQIKVKTISGCYINLYKNDKFRVITKEEYFIESL